MNHKLNQLCSLTKKDMSRLEAIGISEAEYERYAQTLVTSLRIGKSTINSRPIPQKRPKSDLWYPPTNCQITNSLLGAYTIHQYPSSFQPYFVVRIALQDGRHGDELLDQYARVVDTLGLPGAVFSQRQDTRDYVCLFYFMSPLIAGDSLRIQAIEPLALGQALLDHLSALHSENPDAYRSYDPLKTPELFRYCYSSFNPASGFVTEIKVKSGLSLADAIRQSLTDPHKELFQDGSQAIQITHERHGDLQRIESILRRAGLKIRKSDVQVLPTTRTPAELPLSAGSFLLDPVTLARVTESVPEAIRLLFSDGSPRRVRLADLLDGAGDHGLRLRARWRPDLPEERQAGLLAYLVRREWQAGTDEDQAVRAVLRWLQDGANRNSLVNPWLEKENEVAGIIRRLFESWGRPVIELGLRDEDWEAEDETSQPAEHEPSYRRYAPPDSFSVPLAEVRMIHGLGLLKNGRDRKGKERLVHDHVQEEYLFGLIRLYLYLEDGGGAMIHGKLFDEIQGFKHVTGRARRDLLALVGITRVAEGNLEQHRAASYMRKPEAIPPVAPNEPRVRTLNEGLRQILTEQEIREQYSRDHARAILATPNQ